MEDGRKSKGGWENKITVALGSSRARLLCKGRNNRRFEGQRQSMNLHIFLLERDIPAFFLLVLFARGGRKAGESPAFDFKFRKEFRPVSGKKSDRRAIGGLEEGGGGFLECVESRREARGCRKRGRRGAARKKTEGRARPESREFKLY